MSEEINTPGKQDMVDRKAAWIERMFKMLFAAVKENPAAALLVLSIALNFWQFSINNDINQLRIQDITSLNEKINKAVEARVDAKVSEKMVPIQAKTDSVTSNIDTSLTNLNGIVNSIKQSIKKQK